MNLREQHHLSDHVCKIYNFTCDCRASVFTHVQYNLLVQIQYFVKWTIFGGERKIYTLLIFTWIAAG